MRFWSELLNVSSLVVGNSEQLEFMPDKIELLGRSMSKRQEGEEQHVAVLPA